MKHERHHAVNARCKTRCKVGDKQCTLHIKDMKYVHDIEIIGVSVYLFKTCLSCSQNITRVFKVKGFDFVYHPVIKLINDQYNSHPIVIILKQRHWIDS